MLKVHWFGLALAGCFLSSTCFAQFATSVVSFSQGDASDLSPGYTDASAALGAPTTFIGYQDADPFNPPYQTNNLVGLGIGGAITLKFSNPIQHDPTHAFGLDFIIFGHAGFEITNGDYFGGGITDGSFFEGGAGTTRVSVSADGVNFYTLDPSRAPNADGLFPADASGNPLVPVNPTLTAADFAGKDLAGIRTLYARSGGGTGYDLSWAQDSSGRSVTLSSVDYVRVEVLDGSALLDAVSVVPEPSGLALVGVGALVFIIGRRTASGVFPG